MSNPVGSAFKEQATLPFGTSIDSETTGVSGSGSSGTGAPSNQRFTSYDRSEDTGLDYAVNRTYNSGQSRFTTVDPIGMASASIGDPQSLNLFAYTQNNPVDFVDPSGLNASAGNNVCYMDGIMTDCSTVYDSLANGISKLGRGYFGNLGFWIDYDVQTGNQFHSHTESRFILNQSIISLTNQEKFDPCKEKILEPFILGDSNQYKPSDEANINYINAEAADAFQKALNEINRDNGTIAFADVFRDNAMQQRRHDKSKKGGPPASKPGNGAHQAGMAVDVYMPHVNKKVISAFEKNGWTRTMMRKNVPKARKEPWHFQWKGFNVGKVKAAQEYYQKCVVE